jgi:hypothetical protein
MRLCVYLLELLRRSTRPHLRALRLLSSLGGNKAWRDQLILMVLRRSGSVEMLDMRGVDESHIPRYE